MDLAGLSDCDRLVGGSTYANNHPCRAFSFVRVLLQLATSFIAQSPILLLPSAFEVTIIRCLLAMPQIGHLRRQANSLAQLYLPQPPSHHPLHLFTSCLSTLLPSNQWIQIVSKVSGHCRSSDPLGIAHPRILGNSKMARSYLGLLITGLTSFLFFYLGQAHLTSEFTPDLARNIEGWSVGCSEAWWWFALDAESVRTFFPAPSCLPSPLSRSRRSSTSPNRTSSRGISRRFANGSYANTSVSTPSSQLVSSSFPKPPEKQCGWL
jgi:hypothetical protein